MDPKISRAGAFTAAGAYFLMVLCIQGPFLFSSGMGYETFWMWLSESRGTWAGFLNPGDSLRPYLTVFYHVAYLLGHLPGLDNGFASFQIVYAVIWWARGLLIYLILRRLLGGREMFAYAAGAITIVHMSDAVFGWLGYQTGFMLWMLLAVYWLLVTVQEYRPWRACLWGLLSAAAVHLALWTYEAEIFILSLTPVALYVLFRRRTRYPFWVASALWYGVIATFLRLSAARYLGSASSYQMSIVRKDLNAATLASDLWFNVIHSLSPWRWSRITGTDLPSNLEFVLGWTCVAAFAAGALLIRRLPHDSSTLPARTLLRLAAVGLAFLVASFPAFLLLDSARLLYRTQILAAPGAAIVLVALIGLMRSALRSIDGLRPAANIIPFVMLLLLVHGGSIRALEHSAYYRTNWQPHRRAISEILRVAPRVRPSTVLVAINVPKARDPFMNGMWFDLAIRLSYPGVPVGGVFFFDNGAPTPGNPYELASGKWQPTPDAWTPILRDVPFENTLVIDFAGDHPRVSPVVPRAVCPAGCETSNYHPRERIATGPPAPPAAARYGPIDTGSGH